MSAEAHMYSLFKIVKVKIKYDLVVSQTLPHFLRQTLESFNELGLGMSDRVFHENQASILQQ